MSKKLVLISVLATMILGVVLFYFYKTQKSEYNMPQSGTKSTATTTNQVIKMELISSAFQNGADIPKKYTCQGQNINPPLEIKDAPTNTKSFALIMDDPDATNGTFVHWVVWNITPETREISENSIPDSGFEAENSNGQKSYLGPCPPSGKHRYFFKLYALDTMFTNFPENADFDHLMPEIEQHAIAEAELLGLYEKK